MEPKYILTQEELDGLMTKERLSTLEMLVKVAETYKFDLAVEKGPAYLLELIHHYVNDIKEDISYYRGGGLK